MAASVDGRTAAPDGSSQWITGPDARADAHRMRAEGDAVIVGANTVRTTIRAHCPDAEGDDLFVVLGRAPEDARAQPALEMSALDDVLAQLGGWRVKLMVEGAPWRASSTARASSTGTWCTSHPRCSAVTTAGRCSLAPEPPHMEDVWRGRIHASTVRATTSWSSWPA